MNQSVAKRQLELNPRLSYALSDLSGKMPSVKSENINNRFANYQDKSTNYQDKSTNYQDKSTNPISSLQPDEISYIQAYLEQVKVNKINDHARQNNNKYCKSVGTVQPDPRAGVASNSIQNPTHISTYTDRWNEPIVRETPVPTTRTMDTNYRSPILPTDTRGAVSTRQKRADIIQNGIQNMSTGSQDQNDTQYRNNYHNPYEYGSRQNEFGSLYKPTYTGPYNNNPDLLDEMGINPGMYWETFPGDIRNVNLESSLLQREMTHTPGQRELTERELNRFDLLPFDPQDTRHIIWKDNMPRGGYPTRVDRLETL
jgi:hypothetical protein